MGCFRLHYFTSHHARGDADPAAFLDNKCVFYLPKKLYLIAGCVLLASEMAAGAAQLPEGKGKAEVEKICSACHAPDIVMGRHETKERWEQIVSSMVDKGANGTDDEFSAIIDYLATHFSKKSGDVKASGGESVKN